MNTNDRPIKISNTKLLEYFLLITFTAFSLYFSISSYRLYHMKSDDLKAVTHQVESVTFNKAHGKQGKPEVWIDLGLAEKFRVIYGKNDMIEALSNEIKKGDVVTLYLKKAQHLYIDLGSANDVLQIAKSGQVIYSLDIPQKNFHDYYILSGIMSFLLPLGCIFYWVKSKSNSMLEKLQPTTFHSGQLSAK